MFELLAKFKLEGGESHSALVVAKVALCVRPRRLLEFTKGVCVCGGGGGRRAGGSLARLVAVGVTTWGDS